MKKTLKSLQSELILNEAKLYGENIERKHIYIISNPVYGGLFKVGVATDLQSRLGSYQTSDPFRAFVINDSLHTVYYDHIEKHVHNVFENRNEWVYAEDSERIVLEILKKYRACYNEDIEVRERKEKERKEKERLDYLKSQEKIAIQRSQEKSTDRSLAAQKGAETRRKNKAVRNNMLRRIQLAASKSRAPFIEEYTSKHTTQWESLKNNVKDIDIKKEIKHTSLSSEVWNYNLEDAIKTYTSYNLKEINHESSEAELLLFYNKAISSMRTIIDFEKMEGLEKKIQRQFDFVVSRAEDSIRSRRNGWIAFGVIVFIISMIAANS